MVPFDDCVRLTVVSLKAHSLVPAFGKNIKSLSLVMNEELYPPNVMRLLSEPEELEVNIPIPA